MSENIFKRKAYQKMLDWKRESAGKTALLVEGARRVGKSTLVRQFAENEYKSYILIDFANVVPEVNHLIESSIADLDYLFVRLQLIYHVTLERRQSVIIFDEVQLQPLARQAIKYLVQDGRYDYMETGSLISIRQNVQHIVIPSEEERIQTIRSIESVLVACTILLNPVLPGQDPWDTAVTIEKMVSYNYSAVAKIHHVFDVVTGRSAGAGAGLHGM